MSGRAVVCDNCATITGPPYIENRYHEGGRPQRAQAIQLGWRCDETGDWCPDCIQGQAMGMTSTAFDDIRRRQPKDNA